jgi:hypothetical protein
MGIQFDVLGIGMLFGFIVFTRVYICLQAVRSAHRRITDLIETKNNAIQKNENTVHFEKACTILMTLQTQRLDRLRKSIWGRILAMIFSDKLYEIHKT